MYACILLAREISARYNDDSLTAVTMRSFAQLLVIAIASTTTLAQSQFSDGYENVNTATTPVQIRLAYQGPTAMMGKSKLLPLRFHVQKINNISQFLGTRSRNSPILLCLTVLAHSLSPKPLLPPSP